MTCSWLQDGEGDHCVLLLIEVNEKPSVSHISDRKLPVGDDLLEVIGQKLPSYVDPGG